MHRAAYEALGLRDHSYQLLPVPPEAFEDTARALHGSGFTGANVTIPHKEAALAIADTASDAARAIGAANTLTYADDGAIHADNTDAPGLIHAIGRDLAGADVVVLGAGGSARAAAYALRRAGSTRITVVNRTPARARQLADDLGVTAADEMPSRADVLVNTTSVGLDDSSSTFDDLPLDADGLGGFGVVVDLVYRPGGTELLAEAARQGCEVVDGLQMLAAQGALSFELWTGLPAPHDVMRRALSA